MRITFDKYDEIMPLKKLKKNKFQRNKHPQDQIIRLAKIMETHGVRHPIHISKLSGQVCFGHGRWEAAKLNGWDSFPIVYQDFKDEDEEYACVQSDNAIAHWAELDLSSINNDLQNLGPDFDIDLLGIKDFVLEPADKIDPGCDEDEVPEAADTRCKLGDVWQLGRHRLVCGDSTAITDVEKLMGGEKADMVFTDPPYGIGFKYNSHQDTTGDEYKDFCRDWFHILRTKSEFIVISTGWAYNLFWYGQEPKDTFYWICSNKRTGGSLSHFRKVEPVFLWGKPDNRYNFDYWEQTTQIEAELKGKHTCPKPVSLIEAIIAGGKDRGSVLDVFGGSGTTLIACEKTNRRCFMMELDPHYCDVILARWEKYTGQKAERLNGKDGKEEGPGKAKDSAGRKTGKKSGRNTVHNGRNVRGSRVQRRHARA